MRKMKSLCQSLDSETGSSCQEGRCKPLQPWWEERHLKTHNISKTMRQMGRSYDWSAVWFFSWIDWLYNVLVFLLKWPVCSYACYRRATLRQANSWRSLRCIRCSLYSIHKTLKLHLFEVFLKIFHGITHTLIYPSCVWKLEWGEEFFRVVFHTVGKKKMKQVLRLLEVFCFLRNLEGKMVWVQLTLLEV